MAYDDNIVHVRVSLGIVLQHFEIIAIVYLGHADADLVPYVVVYHMLEVELHQAQGLQARLPQY